MILYDIYIYANGWKTACVVVLLFFIWGLGGVGWGNNVHVTCMHK